MPDSIKDDPNNQGDPKSNDGNNQGGSDDLQAKIDAAVTDGVFIDYYAIHTPKTFRVLNDHVPERGFAVGVDPANKELLTQINKALSDMEADGTAQAIYKQWFSEKN